MPWRLFPMRAPVSAFSAMMGSCWRPRRRLSQSCWTKDKPKKRFLSLASTASLPHLFPIICCSDIICVVAGITSDANLLIDHARLTCQRYELNYHEPMPVEQLVQNLCNLKQRYTQHGGLRPFGCSFLIAGWDKIYGYQLYQTDPSGNYGGWKATCIGANNTTATSIFKSDYPDEGLKLEGAGRLLVKVLKKTSESTILSGERLEVATLCRHEDEKKTVQNIISGVQVDRYLASIPSTEMEA